MNEYLKNESSKRQKHLKVVKTWEGSGRPLQDKNEGNVVWSENGNRFNSEFRLKRKHFWES